MLHPIKLPTASQYLDWIVTFQGYLIHALCDPGCHRDQIVDERWIINTCADLNLEIDLDWAGKFCNWKHKDNTLLERLRLIADLDANTKALIQSAFDHDVHVEQAYPDDVNQIYNLIGLANLDHLPDVKELVHCFFESFYDPSLYKGRGYKVLYDGQQIKFDRDTYIEQFAAENQDVMVCPMCDGDLGSPKVDHFLPKAEYPYLSCHLKNLVPICDDCNGPSGKFTKLPLTLTSQNHTLDWLHPYFRVAKDSYDVRFEQLPDGLTPCLVNDNPQINVRLDNFSTLINLRTRWRSALIRKVHATQRKIAKEVRKRNASLNDQEVIEKIEQWCENQECEIGLEPFAILESAYLKSVLQRDPETFDELMVYANPRLDVVSLT